MSHITERELLEISEKLREGLQAEIERLRADYDALATDALGLLDRHLSAEVEHETRLRIIDRLAVGGDPE